MPSSPAFFNVCEPLLLKRMRHKRLILLALCVFALGLGLLLLLQVARSRHRFLSVGSDQQANVVRMPNAGRDDARGWLLDPLKAMAKAGLSSSGATSCRAAHVGEIKPGFVRANHRHHFCNETFIIWNARALYRLENKKMKQGYAQAVLGAGDVSVCTASSGQAHAVVNMDSATLYFMACQDEKFQAGNPMTDYRVWDDL